MSDVQRCFIFDHLKHPQYGLYFISIQKLIIWQKNNMTETEKSVSDFIDCVKDEIKCKDCYELIAILKKQTNGTRNVGTRYCRFWQTSLQG